jgi:hypothetical protein
MRLENAANEAPKVIAGNTKELAPKFPINGKISNLTANNHIKIGPIIKLGADIANKEIMAAALSVNLPEKAALITPTNVASKIEKMNATVASCIVSHNRGIIISVTEI